MAMMQRRLCVVAAAAGLALSSPLIRIELHGQTAAPAQGQMASPIRPSANGPVAISLRAPSEAVVLQIDNVVRTLDLRTWANPGTAFQVPSRFRATDLAAGTFEGKPTMCLTLNPYPYNSKENESYLLQIINDRQVWSQLRPRGVYVGAAFDARHGVAYVSNSSTNQVLRVEVGVGKEKAPATLVQRILQDVERIGPLAIDIANQRLFVADADNRVFAIDLTNRKLRKIDTPGLDDIRAIAWDAGAQRLYVADSGSETVWSVAVDRDTAKPQPLLRDRRYRQPSGLAVSRSGSVLVTDESANAVIEVIAPGRIGHSAVLLSKPVSSRF
jgi:hypothetical protein